MTETGTAVAPGLLEVPDTTKQGRADSVAGKLLLLIVALLMCIGIIVVYSSGAGWAEEKFSDPQYFLWRQLTFAVAGIALIVLVGAVDYHIFMKTSKIVLFVSLGLLALLLAVVALVALEPNFSTATLIALIGFSLMFIGGVNGKHLLSTFSLLIPIAAVFAIAAPYRVYRLATFFSSDPKDMSYQVRQALLGLGNGGLLGLGIGASKQRELYLPLSYNDFVFVIIGEEYGFVGALVVLTLFAGFFICGIIISKNAPDLFGRFVAAGITIAISLFAF
ncbi:MAG: FtsW/RodA/SpoVE family cell cycle protein, partial [Chlorobiales bacterium]|nr:FtsW/RodA/SpoVE family cell cycle protein [Chlorobiales bacterium]